MDYITFQVSPATVWRTVVSFPTPQCYFGYFWFSLFFFLLFSLSSGLEIFNHFFPPKNQVLALLIFSFDQDITYSRSAMPLHTSGKTHISRSSMWLGRLSLGLVFSHFICWNLISPSCHLLFIWVLCPTVLGPLLWSIAFAVI